MMSKQHSEIVNKLQNIFGSYRILVEHPIDDGLRLDIYIPRFCVAIEVNGKQHYEFSQFFHGNLNNFELSKFLDKKKLKYCKELGIGLFVVRYDEDFDVEKFTSFTLKHLSKKDDHFYS